MEILPIAKENCLSMFKILPNTKTPQKLDFYFLLELNISPNLVTLPGFQINNQGTTIKWNSRGPCYLAVTSNKSNFVSIL